MRKRHAGPAVSTILAAAAACSAAQRPTTRHVGPALEPMLRLPMPCNGVATTDDGRGFVCFPHPEGGIGVRIAEVLNGTDVKPYPDLAWNTYKAGDDPRLKFVGANALRFGPDGLLWVVDDGTVGSGTKVVPGGAKLVAIDTKAATVARIIPLEAVIKPDSFIDDIRFNGPNLYITDAGDPALIVMDLANGKGRRVLEHDRSTTASRPQYADGNVMLKLDGKPAELHADQLEVSPDGKTFYFQPCPGPMWTVVRRIWTTLPCRRRSCLPG